MSTKRSCYQCGDDDIEAIKAKRNEEIRAYGRKVLADADAAFFAEKSADSPTLISDWDIIDEPVAEQPIVSSEPDQGTEEVMDALAATEPQETEEIKAKVDESPKPEAQADKAVEVEREVAEKPTDKVEKKTTPKKDK